MLCNIVCLHPYSLYFTARMLLGRLFTARLEPHFTVHFDGILRAWALRKSCKIYKNSKVLPVPQKPKKFTRRPPTGVKMTPKITLPTPNRWIGGKSEILQKPLYLRWLKHIQPLNSSILSIPGSPNRWTWKLSPNLTSQITENYPIVSKVGPRRLPKWTLKSIKIDIWPSMCPLGAPPGPHDYENCAPGTENKAWRFPKLPF